MKKAVILLVFLLSISQVHASRTGVEVTRVAWGDLDNPLIVYPGDENVPLLIEVKNMDDQDLNPIKATLFFQRPFGLLYRQDSSVIVSTRPQVLVVGKIKANQSSILRYSFHVASSAKPGTYRFDLKVAYLEDLINVDYFPIYATVGESSGLIVEEVKLEPENIVAGDTIRIDVRLRNTGTKVLKDIRAELKLDKVKSYGKEDGSPFAPLGSDSSQYIGNLGPKEAREIAFTIISDGSAKPKPYSIDLSLKYRDGNGNSKNETRVIGIPLQGKGDFEIQSLKVSPSIGFSKGLPQVKEGEKISLEFDVINTGTTMANYVTVEIGEASSIYPKEMSSYIGPIEPGDFATVKFDMDVAEGRGNHDIPVEISYVDSYNQKHKITKSISIDVVEASLPKENNPTSKESIFTRFLKWLFGL